MRRGSRRTAATVAAAPDRARVILRDIRQGINEYRDARREGFVRSRNHPMWTGTVTGIAAYVLLGIAILTVSGREAIVAAVAFFLVGAGIGLFDQLRRGSGAETATEEDYGFERARLLYTPLLSGMAAVGGVVVTAMLFGTLTSTNVGAAPASAATAAPTAAAPPTAESAQAQEPPGVRVGDSEVPSLGRIFDLDEDRFGLVIAAVFGLTPGLLVNRLQNQAARYTSELQGTAAQNTAPR